MFELLPLLLFVHLLLLLLGHDGLFDVELAQANQVVDEVLGNLHCLLRMQERLFVPMQLGKQGADLHVNLALVLELLQLFCRLLTENRGQVLRIYLVQAGIQAQSALL